MKTIQVKVNSAANTIAQHQIVTADGKPTVIQAVENVNYQLVDKATGLAPDHILTMRKGNDLLISMSEDNDDVDLIISDYYNNEAALVGQAENGTYYNYIPDTGEVADYVTQLEAGNVSGHALGGEIIATPYWVAAPSEGFGVLPWLLGAGALALAALALAGGGDDAPAKDTKAPNGGKAPTITITDDVNGDGFINREEIAKDGNDVIDVKISFDKNKVEVGDTVVITDNTDPTNPIKKEIVLTQADIDKGNVTTNFAKPAEGSNIVINASIKDNSGNQSEEGERTAKLDTSDLTDTGGKGAGIRIVDDANNDELINATELGEDGIQVEAELPSQAVAGDKLLITATGNPDQEVVLTQAQIDAGKVVVDLPAPANGTEFKVTAQVTDPAGNTSNKAEDSATVSLDKPNAPKVTIVEDADKNGFISKDELDGAIDVNIEVPANAKVGETITITDNAGNTKTIPVTQDVIDNGATASFPAPAEGKEIKVTASVTDAAGNTGSEGTASATRDTSDLTTGLEVTITEDTNNDGKISINEFKDNDIDVEVILPTGAAVGDTLTITGSGNVPQTVVLTQEQINTGKLSVSFDPVSSGSTFTTTATIKDIAGNEGGPVTDKADMQLSAPGAPLVTIENDTNNDGLLNKEELPADGKIDVSIAIPATATAGDTINLDTNGDSTPDLSKILTLEDIQKGSVSFEVPAPTEGDTLKVDAWVTDTAGNKGEPGVDQVTIDTTAPSAPTVTVLDGGDGKLNEAEVKAGVKAEIGLPADAKAGDVLNVDTDGDGNPDITKTLTNEDVLAGKVTVDIPATDIPEEGTLTVTATLTDTAGNPSTPGTGTSAVDTNVPNGNVKPTVEISEDANNDGYINKTELSNDNLIDIKVSFINDKVAVGDTVVVTDNTDPANPVEKTVEITQADKDNGYVTTTFEKPSEDTEVTYNATIKDAAGNESEKGEARATLDTSDLLESNGLAVEITEDEDNNGYITQAELKDNDIDVTVTLPQGATEGDTLTVTGLGNTSKTIVLTQEQVNAGKVSVSFNPVSDGADFKTTATIKDNAGNEGGPVEDTATMQLSKPGKPIVTLAEDENNNGYIAADELDGKIDITVALPATAAAGDTLKLDTNGDGQPDQTKVLELADIQAGNVSFTMEVPNPKEGVTVKAEAWVTDKAGQNGEKGSDDAIIDTIVPGDSDGDGVADEAGKPVVAITDDNDGYINPADLNDDGTANAVITFPADSGYAVGDVMTVTKPDGTTEDITLTQTIIDNGTTVTFTPKDGEDNTVKAVVKDAAGNSSTEGSDTVPVDLTIPTATIAIDDKALTENETSTVTITFSEPVTGFASADDVTVQNGTLTDMTSADGGKTWVGTFTPTEDVKADTNVITLANTYTDLAGNTGTVAKSANYTIDTSYPVISIAVSPAAVAEDSSDKLTYTLTLDKASVLDKTVNVSLSGTATNGTDYTGAVTSVEIPAGSTSVSFEIDPTNDAVVELDETVIAKITSGTGYKIGTDTATGTISNDEKLELSLNSDTLGEGTTGTTTDNLTKDPVINVAKIPNGVAWEYSLDNGGTWQTGSGTSFTLPNNTKVEGIEYKLAARLVGDTTASTAANTTQGTLDMTLDQTTKYSVTDFISKANQPVGATNDKLSGVGEAGSIIFFDKDGDGVLDADETQTTVATDGTWQLDIPETPDGSDVDPINDVDTSQKISVIDKAGNKLLNTNSLYVFDSVASGLATYSMHDRPEDANLTRSTDIRGDGSNRNGLVFDYTPVGGDISIISTGNVNAVDTSSNGNTGDEFKTLTGAGNDAVIVKGEVNSNVHFDLGAGNDVLDLGRSLGGPLGRNFVNMGDGDDLIKVFGDVNEGTEVNLGKGNDIASINGDIDNVIGTVIDGGEGTDTLILTKNATLREAINIQNIKNFEVIDMNNDTSDGKIELDIAYSDLLNSTSEKLYIKGNGNDVVDLGDNGSTLVNPLRDGSLLDSPIPRWSKNTSETVDGTTYDVYQHSSDTSAAHLVYIEQGISVI